MPCHAMLRRTETSVTIAIFLLLNLMKSVDFSREKQSASVFNDDTCTK